MFPSFEGNLDLSQSSEHCLEEDVRDRRASERIDWSSERYANEITADPGGLAAASTSGDWMSELTSSDFPISNHVFHTLQIPQATVFLRSGMSDLTAPSETAARFQDETAQRQSTANACRNQVGDRYQIRDQSFRTPVRHEYVEIVRREQFSLFC